MSGSDNYGSVLNELLWAKKRLESIFESNAAGIFVVDENRDIIMVNQRFCDIVGFSNEELVGQNACFAHISQESCLAFRDYFLRAKEGLQVKVEYFVRKKGCEGVWVEMFGSKIELDETHSGVIWSIIDISERKAAEETIKNMAFYDALTGLVNRRLLEDRLSVMVGNAKRDAGYGAVLFIDLDNFKTLNDQFGHQAGDCVLVEAASRLLACVREIDTVARLGGDEFVVVVSGLNCTEEMAQENIQRIASKILDTLCQPYLITLPDEEMPTRNIENLITASIGCTLFNGEEKTIGSLLRRADEAMYLAKKTGKNSIQSL